MIATLYRQLLRRALFRLDAETAHHLAMWMLTACTGSRAGLELLRGVAGVSDDKVLTRTVFGVRFPNPVGLAAGFDKDGVALRAWAALGFGFIEAGTLTPRPQPGNPRPRMFRLPAQRGLINRLGFNNHGAPAAAARFAALRAAGQWPGVPVGINLGRNKDTPNEDAAADYVRGLETLHGFADYFALNVSSPNTPGLRGLQNRDELDALLSAVQAANRARAGAGPRTPVLLKIAPDLEWSQIEEILDLATRHGLAGIIATNTTVSRDALPPNTRHAAEAGGLSGAPLRARATAVVRFLAERGRLPVVAVGGVADAASAREKLDAGASLVQIYTGFIYGGPTLVPEICRGLASPHAAVGSIRPKSPVLRR